MRRIPNGTEPRWSRSDEGFSLAELVIAVAVILVVSMGVLSAAGFAAAALGDSQKRDAALAIATNQIEYARSMAFDSVVIPSAKLTSSFTTTTAQGVMTVTQAVTSVQDTYDASSARYYTKTSKYLAKRMVVTVSWTSGVAGNVGLDTLLTGSSTDANFKP